MKFKFDKIEEIGDKEALKRTVDNYINREVKMEEDKKEESEETTEKEESEEKAEEEKDSEDSE